MGAIPTLGHGPERLVQIPGTMPRLDAIPQGCAFHPRCAYAFDRCRVERPDAMPAGESQAACWLVAQNGAESPIPNGAPKVARAPA
jgi:peptide/nickel transport system ATP-binding protein